MKINDFIFRYPTEGISDGICRVRTFWNSNKQVVALIMDLGDKNTSTYFITMVYNTLIQEGFLPEDTICIDHYERKFHYEICS